MVPAHSVRLDPNTDRRSMADTLASGSDASADRVSGINCGVPGLRCWLMATDDEFDELPTTKAIEHVMGDDVVGIAADYLEIGLDRALDLADEVPFLRTLVGVGRATMQARDWLYLRKLFSFYRELGEVDPGRRREFVERELSSTEDRQRAGELILGVVDHASTSTKAGYAGRVLGHCIDHGIAWSLASRVLEMVNGAYLSDLRYLVAAGEEIGETGDEVEHLLSLGFYERTGKRFGDTVMWSVQPVLSCPGRVAFDALKVGLGTPRSSP